MIGLALLAGAHGAELSVDAERTVQIAAAGTAYGFAALHTGLLVDRWTRGGSLQRSWVAGTFESSVSLVGLGAGYGVLAVTLRDDPDAAWTAALAGVPLVGLGGVHLGGAIDGAIRGDGDLWAEPGPAAVTLVHGAALSGFGIALAVGANPETSDLSKLGPIYTWAGTGALLSSYAIASLLKKRR